MAWRLSVIRGDQRGQKFSLHEGENFVGRSRKCDVTLSSDALDISGRHVVIVVSGNHVEAENLGRHGTKVDGVSLTAPDVIRAGQHIALAQSTELVLEACESADKQMQGQPPPSPPPRDTGERHTPDSAAHMAPSVGPDRKPPHEPDSMLGLFMDDAPSAPPSDNRNEAFAVPVEKAPPPPAHEPPAWSADGIDDIPSGFIDIQIGPDDDAAGDTLSAPPSSFHGASISFDAATSSSALGGGEDLDDDNLFSGLSDLASPLEAPPTMGASGPKTHGISPEAVDYLRELQKRKELKRRLLIAIVALALFGVLAYVVIKF